MISTFFSSIQVKIMAVLLAGSLTLAGVFFVQKIFAERSEQKAQVELAAAKENLFKKQIEVSGLKIVVTTLEDTYKKLAVHLEAERQIEREIDESPAEEDGAISPVLRRSLDSVDRMLRNR